MSEDKAENLLKQININNNGIISYTEFVAYHLDVKAKLSKENLRTVFNAFDIDEDGLISMKDLK